MSLTKKIIGLGFMSMAAMCLIPMKPGYAALECKSYSVSTSKNVVKVSSASSLKTAIAASKGGQTFVLSPGNYGSLSYLSGKKTSQPITIISADKNNMAVVTSTSLQNSANIVLANLRFFAEGSGAVPSWGNVTPPNTDYDGLPKQPGKVGLTLASSSNITVTGSVFSGHNRGIYGTKSKNITITGNVFKNTTMDHMAFNAMDGVLIEGNYTGAFKAFWASHNDSIQFWNTGATSGNITIKNNVITSSELPGSKGGVQGVFIFNEDVARQGGNTTDFYRNIVVTGNKIVTTHPNALTISAAHGVRVQNNIVLADCSNRKSGWDPRLTVYKGDTNVVITGNKANLLHAAELNPTVKASMPAQWTVSGNSTTSQCVNDPAPVAPGCD